MTKNKVGNKETIVLIDSNFKRYFIDTDAKTDKVKGVGVINPSCFIGKRYGEKIEIGNKEFYLLKPSLMDKLKGLKRKAQIILPKESAYIVMFSSIESGDNVLEAGIGSGSLTIALASAVAPDGKVISYDKRTDFIKYAKNNLEKSGFLEYVETKHKDITKGIDEKNLDAIVLDIPNPWDAINHSYNSLKIGGYLCCYSPLISQVEKTVKEIKKHNFIEINTFENIQREMIVSDYGTRPSFDMLGHTGYLTFARKIL